MEKEIKHNIVLNLRRNKESLVKNAGITEEKLFHLKCVQLKYTFCDHSFYFIKLILQRRLSDKIL